MLRSPNLNVLPEDRNNLRFYVAMYAVAGIDNASNPKPNAIANFDLSSLDEVAIGQSLDYIRPKYVQLGGNNQVSKRAFPLEVSLGRHLIAWVSCGEMQGL